MAGDLMRGMADLFNFRLDGRKVPGGGVRPAASEAKRYLSLKGEVKGERQ
jgi:hypothetical protein